CVRRRRCRYAGVSVDRTGGLLCLGRSETKPRGPPADRTTTLCRHSALDRDRFQGASDEAGVNTKMQAQPARKPSMWRALSHKNYQLFFSGQGISLIGTWMTRTATSWLVYRLTGSALLLGVVGFAGQIPSFLLAPFAGVLVDRWNRHRLLVATQVLALLQSL